MYSPSAGPSCIICCIVFHSHPDRNEFWLRRDFTRCCIYFYILCHCSGKISPPSDKQNLEKWLKMDLLWTKCDQRALQLFEVFFLPLKAVELLSRSPCAYFCWQRDNRGAEMSADKSNANRRKQWGKKKHFVIPVLPKRHQRPPPWAGYCLKSVQCAAHSRCLQTPMKLVKQPKMLLSLSFLSADKGSKVRKLTLKNKREKNPDSGW